PVEPLRVEGDPHAVRSEHPHDLRLVGLGVLDHFVPRHRRTGHVPPRRVADHGREVADDEHDLMAELLESPHAREHERVAQVEIGPVRVEPGLYEERRLLAITPRKTFLQLRRRVDVDRPASHLGELLFGRGALERVHRRPEIAHALRCRHACRSYESEDRSAADAQRYDAEMRGPAWTTFGTPCSKPIWHAPPMTSRSPDAGDRSIDLPPPRGRIRKGRRAPSVRMATRVSSRRRSSRSRWDATLSRPSR